MNRIIVYGLIAFLVWQAYEQYKTSAREPDAAATVAQPAPSRPAGSGY